MHAEFGVTKTIDLIPNGSNIPVTRENRLQYMYPVAHYRLTQQIKKQSNAFFEGLFEIIDPTWLRCVSSPSVLSCCDRLRILTGHPQDVQPAGAADPAGRG